VRIVVALTVATVLFASTTVFATELDQFRNKVEKLAPTGLDLTPPVVCVCKDGGEHHNRTGQLANALEGIVGSLASIKVRCRIHIFDTSTGDFHSGDTCETWELLRK
jgi:hypothetical protein